MFPRSISVSINTAFWENIPKTAEPPLVEGSAASALQPVLKKIERWGMLSGPFLGGVLRRIAAAAIA